jgi:hypothetical protein
LLASTSSRALPRWNRLPLSKAEVGQKRHCAKGNRMRQAAFPEVQAHLLRQVDPFTTTNKLTKGCDMPRVKQAAKHARTTQAAAVTALGAAGLGLSLTGSASASTIPTAYIPQSDSISPNQRFVLGEEEMADVSLATFYLFDKENAGSDVQLAAVVVRRGCGGCRGCRGCRAVRGCGGCGGCGGCCARWGRCRWC